MKRIIKKVWFLLFFFCWFLHAMEEDQESLKERDQSLSNVTSAKKQKSLKKICCKVLIQKTPHVIQKYMSERVDLEALKYTFACEVARSGSCDFFNSIIESTPPSFLPRMALGVLKRNDLTREESKDLLRTLLDCSKKKDDYAHHVITEIKSTFDASHCPLKRLDLFCYSLAFNPTSCVLNRFLLKKAYFKQYFIEQTLSIPQDKEFFLDLINENQKLYVGQQYYDKLLNFAQQHRTSIATESNKQKVAYAYAVRFVYCNLLLRLQKLRHLGFVPLEEYTFVSNSFDGFDVHNKELSRDKVHESCIAYILHHLKKYSREKHKSLYYARFKLLFDGQEYEQENREYLGSIQNFYSNNSKNSMYFDTDFDRVHQRYAQDFLLVSSLLTYHNGFYTTALKFLLPFFKEEFEQKKAAFARLFKVSEEEVEEHILQNPFYNAEHNESKWSALEEKFNS